MYYLGIDLHKRESTWVLLSADGTPLDARTVPVTPAAIHAALQSLPKGDLHAALEPVCGWRWVYALLTGYGAEVSVANPTKTRLIGESRMKYDRLDAQILADLLRVGYLPTSYVAQENIQSLRDTVRERAYLIHMRTALKNRIKAVLNARYPAPDPSFSRRGLSQLSASGDRELVELVSLLQTLSKAVVPLDTQLRAWSARDETAQLLMSIPAIGPVTAATIVGEVGEFSRFPSARHLASYAGLVPKERSSGGQVRHGSLTKQGSKLLRTALVESAMRIRPQHDDSLYGFYERVRKSSSPMRARVALARKMLTISFSVVTRRTPFTHTIVNTSKTRDELVNTS